MIKFNEYLNEALIMFGGQKQTRFNQVVILAGGAGCHAKGEQVLMYSGEYKNVESISVGDVLMGTDSTPRTVLELHSGISDMLLTETKNDSYITNMSHIHSFVCSFDEGGFKKGEIYDMTFSEFDSLNSSSKKSLKLFKNNTPLIFQDTTTSKIDPWLVGLWLADGTVGCPNITIENTSPLIEHITNNVLSPEYSISKIKTDKLNCSAYSITTTKTKNNPFRDYVETLTTIEGRVIPKELLLGSVEDRKSLLAGLIDGDGHYNKGFYEIISKYDRLSNDIKFLASSLGYQVRITDKFVDWNGDLKRYNRISISGDMSGLPIVLDYKKYVGTPNKIPTRFSPKFTKLDESEYFGFSLDGDMRYILKNWIVTHNSGKGFVKENLLGIEGWVFDVDRLKALAIMSNKFSKMVLDKTGYDLKKFNLRKPEDVSKIHDILGSLYKIDKRYQSKQFTSILTANKDRKPNLIFDVTMKDISKLDGIARNVLELGYSKEDIHIVWVVNDVKVAMKQNKERDRVVPEDILLMTHEGAAFTMDKILKMGMGLTNYMDGMIWLVFNKVGVDAEYVGSKNGGHYIKTANYIKVKERGKTSIKLSELGDKFLNKIRNYIPQGVLNI